MTHRSGEKTVVVQVIEDLVGQIRELEETVRVLFECLRRTQQKLDERNRATRRLDVRSG